MTRWLFVQYLAIHNTENLPNSKNISKIKFKILLMTEWTFKILPKIFTILPNWRIFAKSGHSGIGLSRCSTCIKTFTTCSKVQVNRIACQCHPSRLTKYVLAKWVVSSNEVCKVVLNKCTIFGWHWRKKPRECRSVRSTEISVRLWSSEICLVAVSCFSSLLKLLFLPILSLSVNHCNG